MPLFDRFLSNGIAGSGGIGAELLPEFIPN
jgi:hypothetical protein